MDLNDDSILDFDDEKYQDFLLNFQIQLSNQPEHIRINFMNFMDKVIESTYQKMIKNEFNKEDPYYPLLLNNLLGLYEEREEYDRCIELKKLIDNIKSE
jgi:hypothetical protein